MIKSYLTDTVNIIPITSDDLGSKTEGAAVEAPARVKYEVKTVMSERGQEIQSTAQLMLESSSPVQHDYKIQVTKIRGEAAAEPGKKYQVIKKDYPHGFSASQGWLKVWIV